MQVTGGLLEPLLLTLRRLLKDVTTGRLVKEAWDQLLGTYVRSEHCNVFDFPLWVLNSLGQDAVVLCLRLEFGENTLDGIYTRGNGKRILMKICNKAGLIHPHLLALWFSADALRTPSNETFAKLLLEAPIFKHSGEDEPDDATTFFAHCCAKATRRWAQRQPLDLRKAADRGKCIFACTAAGLESWNRTRLVPTDFGVGKRAEEEAGRYASPSLSLGFGGVDDGCNTGEDQGRENDEATIVVSVTTASNGLAKVSQPRPALSRGSNTTRSTDPWTPTMQRSSTHALLTGSVPPSPVSAVTTPTPNNTQSLTASVFTQARSSSTSMTTRSSPVGRPGGTSKRAANSTMESPRPKRLATNPDLGRPASITGIDKGTPADTDTSRRTMIIPTPTDGEACFTVEAVHHFVLMAASSQQSFATVAGSLGGGTNGEGSSQLFNSLDFLDPVTGKHIDNILVPVCINDKYWVTAHLDCGGGRISVYDFQPSLELTIATKVADVLAPLKPFLPPAMANVSIELRQTSPAQVYVDDSSCICVVHALYLTAGIPFPDKLNIRLWRLFFRAMITQSTLASQLPRHILAVETSTAHTHNVDSARYINTTSNGLELANELHRAAIIVAKEHLAVVSAFELETANALSWVEDELTSITTGVAVAAGSEVVRLEQLLEDAMDDAERFQKLLADSGQDEARMLFPAKNALATIKSQLSRCQYLQRILKARLAAASAAVRDFGSLDLDGLCRALRDAAKGYRSECDKAKDAIRSYGGDA